MSWRRARFRPQSHDQIAVDVDWQVVRRQVRLGWSFWAGGFTHGRSSMMRGTIDLGPDWQKGALR